MNEPMTTREKFLYLDEWIKSHIDWRLDGVKPVNVLAELYVEFLESENKKNEMEQRDEVSQPKDRTERRKV